MKTATDVLAYLDEKIETFAAECSELCIDALSDYSDVASYREAIRQASQLKALKQLRKELAAAVEVSEGSPAKSLANAKVARRRRRATATA